LDLEEFLLKIEISGVYSWQLLRKIIKTSIDRFEILPSFIDSKFLKQGKTLLEVFFLITQLCLQLRLRLDSNFRIFFGFDYN
jgi:hypothetical protein